VPLTALARDAKFSGNVDVALLVGPASFDGGLEVSNRNAPARFVPGRSAQRASYFRSRGPLCGSPCLETVGMEVVLACSLAEHHSFATKFGVANRTVPFDGPATAFFGVVGGLLIVSTDTHTRRVLKYLLELRVHQSKLVLQVSARSQDANHGPDHVLALVALFSIGAAAGGLISNDNGVHIARAPSNGE
jgi:hypothetical protein